MATGKSRWMVQKMGVNLVEVSNAVLGCHTERCEAELARFEERKRLWVDFPRPKSSIGWVNVIGDPTSGKVIMWDGANFVWADPPKLKLIGRARSINPAGTAEIELI